MHCQARGKKVRIIHYRETLYPLSMSFPLMRLCKTGHQIISALSPLLFFEPALLNPSIFLRDASSISYRLQASLLPTQPHAGHQRYQPDDEADGKRRFEILMYPVNCSISHMEHQADPLRRFEA